MLYAITVLTVDKSRLTEGYIKQRAQKFSLMMVCVTTKHVAETQ